MDATAKHRITVAVSVLPFLILTAHHPQHLLSGDYAAYAGWAIALYGLIEFPRQVWAKLRCCADLIDALCGQNSVPSRPQFAAATSRLLSRWRAVGASLCVCVGALLNTYVHWKGVSEGSLEFALLSALAGFLAGQAAYFICVGALFCRRIGYSKHLSLYPYLPSSTPGLTAVSDCYRLEAQLGSLLVFFVTIPLLISTHQHPSVSGIVLRACGIATGLVSVMVIGVIGQRWIARTASIARDQALSDV